MNSDTSSCDPGGTQTHDLQNRNLTFYSTKLRGRFLFFAVCYGVKIRELFFARHKSTNFSVTVNTYICYLTLFYCSAWLRQGIFRIVRLYISVILNIVYINMAPIHSDTVMSNPFSMAGEGFVFSFADGINRSFRNIYTAGMDIAAIRKSSGIPYRYVFDSPIKAQWQRSNTMNRLALREWSNNNPIVNVTTEQGITGDVIVGNVMPRAIESIG